MKKVLIVLVVVLAGLCAVIALQPATYRVERSATVGAPPEVAYVFVADFNRWVEWSPWEKLDPSMKRTFEGTPASVGSTYAWKGNKDVGSGKMTLTAVKPNESLDIKLEFFEPFASTSTTQFRFAPEGQSTKVTWVMSGDNNFVGKAFSLFMDMDAMIGKAFDEGLANLKGKAEAEAKKRAEAAAAAAAAAPAAPAEGAPAAPAPAAAQ